jgi:hypothetical protein
LRRRLAERHQAGEALAGGAGLEQLALLPAAVDEHAHAGRDCAVGQLDVERLLLEPLAAVLEGAGDREHRLAARQLAQLDVVALLEDRQPIVDRIAAQLQPRDAVETLEAAGVLRRAACDQHTEDDRERAHGRKTSRMTPGFRPDVKRIGVMRLMIPLALLLAACPRAAKPDESQPDDLVPEGTAMSLRVSLEGAAGELTLTLSPPKALPTWSCTGRAQGQSFACLAPVDWFKGAGEYELLAEWSRGKSDVVRALARFPVDGKGGEVISIFGLEQPRRHLELLAGRADGPPSRGAAGALTRDEIKSEVQRHEDKLHACFQGALEDTPGLTTRVTAWFLISADGTIRAASADGAASSPAFVYCVLARVRQFKFPPPKGGALAVTYPWTFKAP